MNEIYIIFYVGLEISVVSLQLPLLNLMIIFILLQSDFDILLQLGLLVLVLKKHMFDPT
jgi:hypothetical protein